MRFLSRRRRWSALIVIGSAMVLSQFQNCAPAPTSGLNGAAPGEGSEVRIVDRWYAEKISFMASTYYVEPDVTSVNIEGLCNDEAGSGAVEWQAVHHDASMGADEVLSAGVSSCEGGGFDVQLAWNQASLSQCDDTLEVRASVPGQAGQASTHLRLNCQ